MEHIIILVTGQINGQAVIRHGHVFVVFVLVFDLAVLVAKGQDTGTGAARMDKGHSKLCRISCFDLTFRIADGHADLLCKVMVLATFGLFVGHQIILIRTRQVQILRILSSGGCSQLTAILRVGAVDGGSILEAALNGDDLIFLQVNIDIIALEGGLFQVNTALDHFHANLAVFDRAAGNFRIGRIVPALNRASIRRCKCASLEIELFIDSNCAVPRTGKIAAFNGCFTFRIRIERRARSGYFSSRDCQVSAVAHACACAA